MEPLSNTSYLVGYIISNVFAILLVIAAIKRPKLARLLFFLLFAWAFGMNYYVSHNRPEAYLEYADEALPFYKSFINGWFSDHITEMVSLIAFGQAIIAVGMLFKGWWVKLACIGAIIFLVAIAPLGLYAGFPFSIIASIAVIFILKKDDLNFLWKFDQEKTIVTTQSQNYPN